MRVYHGTNERFNKFSLDKIGSNTNVTKAGFFFTDSIETAKSYGDIVLVCDIEMNSPILCDFNGGSTYYFGEEKWYTPNGLAERIAEINDDLIKYHDTEIGVYGKYELDPDYDDAENDDPQYLYDYSNFTPLDYLDTLGEEVKGYDHSFDDYIDGIICKDVKDNMGLEGKPCTNYIVFKPEQIKVLKELKEDWIDDIDFGNIELDDLDLSVPEPEPEPVKVDYTEHWVVLDKSVINDNFARWFGNSYCCNSKNEPIVVYHSTNAEFDTFKKGLDGTANGQVYGGGFCFSAYEDYTKDFGKNTMPCVLSIQRPLRLGNHTKLSLMTTYKLMYKDDWKKYYDDPDHVARGYLETKCENVTSCFQLLNSEGYSFEEIMDAYGYDGIIDGHVFIVVRPNQIKSINNKGTWSKTSDNIYESEELNDAFYKWFGNSKIVNPDGTPKIVYHSTNSKFKKFNLKKLGFASEYPTADFGFYFSDSGLGYGKIKMPCYIKMENPYYIEVEEVCDFDYNYKNIDKNEFNGYDGLIIHSKKDSYYKRTDVYDYCVFSPNQIKSVNNKGTWNPASDNIYESLNKELRKYL